MSEELRAARDEAEAFASTHLQALADEVLEWHSKSVLRDGKMRELGEICRRFTGEHGALRVAESFVSAAALRAALLAPAVPQWNNITPEKRTQLVLNAADNAGLHPNTVDRSLPKFMRFVELLAPALAPPGATAAVPEGMALVPVEPTPEWFQRVAVAARVWPTETAPPAIIEAIRIYHGAMLSLAEAPKE